MPTEIQRKRLYFNSVKLFYSKGFSATTMRDIASSMNFEAASLYNYISSKDALLEELLFSVADKFLNGIIEIRSSELSSLEKIKSVIRLYIQITSENPYKAALLTSDWRNLKDDVKARFLDHRGQYENELKEILIQYFDENHLTDVNANIALHSFLGSTRWIYDWYINHKEDINLKELEMQLTNIILNGLLQPIR